MPDPGSPPNVINVLPLIDGIQYRPRTPKRHAPWEQGASMVATGGHAGGHGGGQADDQPAPIPGLVMTVAVAGIEGAVGVPYDRGEPDVEDHVPYPPVAGVVHVP